MLKHLPTAAALTVAAALLTSAAGVIFDNDGAAYQGDDPNGVHPAYTVVIVLDQRDTVRLADDPTVELTVVPADLRLEHVTSIGN